MRRQNARVRIYCRIYGICEERIGYRTVCASFCTPLRATKRAGRDTRGATKNQNRYGTAASRGEAYRGINQFDNAIRDYTEVIRLDPSNAFAYGGRGIAYGMKSQQNQAIADLEMAIRLNTDNQWARDRLREIRGR
jgi:tetratricopeptide (TPR) repeat protein